MFHKSIVTEFAGHGHEADEIEAHKKEAQSTLGEFVEMKSSTVTSVPIEAGEVGGKTHTYHLTTVWGVGKPPAEPTTNPAIQIAPEKPDSE